MPDKEEEEEEEEATAAAAKNSVSSALTSESEPLMQWVQWVASNGI